MRKSLLSLAVLGALSVPTISFAADAAPAVATPDWTFPSSIGMVSDYIWRGQTQTWGKPAVQAGIEADHASGFYAGVWGSNVSSHWLPNANLETDWSVGFRNAFATDFKYDVGGTYIYYPGGNFDKVQNGGYPSSKLNSLELYASLGWKWFAVKGGYMPTKFYGWTTANSAAPTGFPGDTTAGVTGSTNGAYYFMGSASYDVMPSVNVAGEVGRQTIANSTGLDWTWYKVGATKNFDGGWAVNAFYTGTAGSAAYQNFGSFDNPADKRTIDQSKVVIGLSKSF
jgi:uncharacterized protein (TIGR02001 family)